MIKKLQNNYTTPEQSKRLLELGVPADSADCYLLRTYTKGDTFIVEVLHDELYSKKDKFTNMLEYIPCWSVGRLIEIYSLCVTCDPNVRSPMLGSCNNTELLVVMLEYAKGIYVLDFSKLEE